MSMRRRTLVRVGLFALVVVECHALLFSICGIGATHSFREIQLAAQRKDVSELRRRTTSVFFENGVRRTRENLLAEVAASPPGNSRQALVTELIPYLDPKDPRAVWIFVNDHTTIFGGGLYVRMVSEGFTWKASGCLSSPGCSSTPEIRALTDRFIPIPGRIAAVRD